MVRVQVAGAAPVPPATVPPVQVKLLAPAAVVIVPPEQPAPSALPVLVTICTPPTVGRLSVKVVTVAAPGDQFVMVTV